MKTILPNRILPILTMFFPVMAFLEYDICLIPHSEVPFLEPTAQQTTGTSGSQA